MSSLHLNISLEVGGGSLNTLAQHVVRFNFQKPLIVTDSVMVKLGYVERVQTLLKESAIQSEVFSECVPDPTVSSIMQGTQQVHQHQSDSIIALGGGSALDSAKAMSLIAVNGGQLKDYKVPHIFQGTSLPVIAIPTTAGTGSEMTRFTIITDEQSDEKMLIATPVCLPILAIVDYQLSLSVPPRTVADTAIDSLTHGIESYVSRVATLVSQQSSLTAIKLIAPNLRACYQDAKNFQQNQNCTRNFKAREEMMLGATFGGIAINTASVALVHGMSRPLGAFFHIPHGLSNAMLLPMVTEFSISGNMSAYADCAKAMGLQGHSDEVLGLNLLKELQALNQDLEVPTLSEYGVEKSTYYGLIETMAQQALDSGSPQNNPVLASFEQICDLYNQLWK